MSQNQLPQFDWIILRGLTVYIVLNLVWSGLFYSDTGSSLIPLAVANAGVVFLVFSILFGPPIALILIGLTHAVCASEGLTRPSAFISIVVIVSTVAISFIDLLATAQIFAGC